MKSLTRNINLNCIILPIVFLAFASISISRATPPWEQIHKLYSSNGTAEDDFGNSVAISGNIGVMGAPLSDENGINSGSAYIFNVLTGKQLHKLTPSDGADDDRFGIDVAIDGNIAVISAAGDDDNGIDSGSAYVFDVSTGKQIFKLLPPDGASGDFFGSSVAILGNIAAIGADFDDENGHDSGLAYLYDVTTGEQLFKIMPSDAMENNFFGRSVSLDGNRLLVGANGGFGNEHQSGSAYVFDVSTGQELSKLIATDGEFLDAFGISVAIKGTTAVIGASGDGSFGYISGAAYVFDLSTGQQVFKIIASDGASGDLFGRSVSLSGNIALIGAPYHDGNGDNYGSVYFFDVNTREELAEFVASDTTDGDLFGYSVALRGNIALCGALGNDGNTVDSGSAYIFVQRTTDLLSVKPAPLLSGRGGRFTITGARPNQSTWLIYSLVGLEKNFIHQLNVTIDLSNPLKLFGPKLTDSGGNMRITLPMPGTLNPVLIWFQAVQSKNATNYIATQIVP